MTLFQLKFILEIVNSVKTYRGEDGVYYAEIVQTNGNGEHVMTDYNACNITDLIQEIIDGLANEGYPHQP